MAQSDKSRARSPWRTPACAALGVALWLLGWGCLNPWPDDYPSSEGSPNANNIEPPAVDLPSDDLECGSNPLLQDCDEDETPGSTNGQAPDESSNEPDVSGEPEDDAGRGDAGAPDASVSANQ